MLLDVLYAADTLFKGDLSIQFYKYDSKDDSILVLSKKLQHFTYKQGANKYKADLSKNDTNTFYERKFYEILKRTGSIPPGSYKMLTSVKKGDMVFRNVYLHDVDSLLQPNSAVRKDINKSLASKQGSFLGIRLKHATSNAKASGAGTAFMHRKNKLDKAVKRRGLRSVHAQRNGRSYADLYYQDWYAGRYEVKDKGSLSRQIEGMKDDATNTDPGANVTNELGDASLLSQYKTLNRKKGKDEVIGAISLTTNSGTGQEQNSGVDNNYYELKGMVEVPIMGIPMDVEGYYTSQDAHRNIHSSYFRIHYDADKMKDGLFRTINSFNTKFTSSASKQASSEQIFKAVISKLEGQKKNLQHELDKEKGTGTSGSGKGLIDTPGMIKEGENEAEEGSGKKKKIEDLHEKLETVDKQIEKYNTLLAQSKNTTYFDSALGYSKTRDVGNGDNMSYKQMAKKGTNMLPDGKAKNVLAGITTMDAGMFPKYSSKYTMSGQMMKGVDLGYDMGFCETDVTIGKTEFAGRDGNPDKYTCYSGKASFKPAKEQKMSLMYYGYSADRKLYSGDGFFNKVNVSAPGFFEPVHIISAGYTGAVSKFVNVEGEAATSLKSTDKMIVPEVATTDKMAYHLTADGNIPNTSVSLGAGYDKTGKGFENKTLPVSMTGTEQYKATARTDLFRAFFTVGVEFNRLTQTSFATSGSSTKWGFDAKTNFKRYPNLACSYKPYTTFHSYTDTLNVPQRPLFGSVLTGKTTYQLRRKDRSWRFAVMYNECITTMDTTRYGSSTLQASCIYATKQLVNSVTTGFMQTLGTVMPAQTAPGRTNFLSLSTSYMISKQLSLTGGQEIGTASFGFSRYSVNGGVMYTLQKVPVTIRMNMRYNTYILNHGDNWYKIYSGSLDIAYRFKVSTK